MTLFSAPNDPWSHRTRIVLAEKGISIDIVSVEAGRFPETIAAILGHLYIHQIHHRGQVHAMLSGTSVAPPQLDEFFLDQDLHLRRDELRALALPET